MIIVDKKKPRKPCYLLGLGALLLAGTVSADTCSKNLMPPFTAAQAVELCATFLGTATLSSTITPGSNAAYDLGTSAAAMRSIYYATSILLNDNAGLIGSTTADAADTAVVDIAAANTGNDSARSAFIRLQGNEASGAGDAAISAGGASGSRLLIDAPASNGTIDVAAASVGNIWQFESDGDFTSQASNGGNLIFANTAKGLTMTPASLAATGSVQGDAAAIVARVSTVTAADGTKGIILPASPVAGDLYIALNTAAAILKIYPGTGDTINATPANTAVSIAASVPTWCIAASASAWWCFEGVAP